MLKGRTRTELKSDCTIPDAYIIDELNDQETNSHHQYDYVMPHLYDLERNDQASSTADEYQTVIIIEL
jgi:hypothetical protein